jgi:hypothetical protein
MISVLVEDHKRWQLLGDFYVPYLLSLQDVKLPDRIVQFWRDGAVAAIHMLRLGQGPDPLSPWWILAAIIGDDNAVNLTLDYIYALDPASAKLLTPWFRFSPSDILPLEGYWEHPVAQLFVVYLNERNVSVEDITIAFHLLKHHSCSCLCSRSHERIVSTASLNVAC